jgi:excisionase family DNA binding protein
MSAVELMGWQPTAKLLGVSQRQLQRLVKDGVVPNVRLGYRTVRFRPDDIAAVQTRLRVPAVWEKGAKP